MKVRILALLAALAAVPCHGSAFLPGVDGAAKRAIEQYVQAQLRLVPTGTATNLSAFGGQFTISPVANVGFVCNDNFTVMGMLYGSITGSASYADTAGSANSYNESDPVALSMGFLDADGVQAQIGLAILSAGQISNPEWWGFLTSESDPVAMSQGFVTGAPWQSEGYLTSLSGHGTSELNNDSGFIAASGDLFGNGLGFHLSGYAYGTEARIPDYEQDRVAMSQGFLTSESDPVAMAAGFVTPSAVGASDVSSMAYVDGNGTLQCAAFMNPSAYEFDPVAMSQGFVSFAGGTEGDLVVVSGGGLGTADPGTIIAAVASAQGFLTSESDPVAMSAGFITGGDVPGNESDPVAMSQGFLNESAVLSSLTANGYVTPDPYGGFSKWGSAGQGQNWQHDNVDVVPGWLLVGMDGGGYGNIVGLANPTNLSVGSVISGVGQTFSLTNAFAGVTQVVVFSDGVVTNRFTLP